MSGPGRAPGASHAEHCARAAHAVTRRSGSSFYAAFLMLPAERRDAILTIYAWCRLSDDIVDEPGPKEARRAALDRWRGELEGAFKPDPSGISHPTVRALWDVLRRFPIPREHFVALLDGVAMDLDRERYASAAELEDYAYHVASVVGLMSIEVFGYRDPSAKIYASTLGKALQLTNILRDVAGDLEQGRIYLPLEDLARHPGALEDLLSRRDSAALSAAAAETGRRAREFFAAADRALAPGDRATLFPAEIMKQVYLRILDGVEARGFRLFGPRIRVAKATKMWIAAREWARARLGSGRP